MKSSRAVIALLAFIMLAAGLALIALYLILDLDGFLKGMCQGAAFMLIVLSAYFVVLCVRRHGLTSTQTDDWLPSRDRTDQQ